MTTNVGRYWRTHRTSPDIAPAGHWPHHKLMNLQSRMTIYQIYSRVHFVTGQRSIPALPCPGTPGLGLPSNRARKGLPGHRVAAPNGSRQDARSVVWWFQINDGQRRMGPFGAATRRDGSHFVHYRVSLHFGIHNTSRSSFLVVGKMCSRRGDLASLFWPYSFGYGSQSSPAPSRTCSAAASGMLVQYPG